MPGHVIRRGRHTKPTTRQSYSVRAFWLTFLLFTIFGLYSLWNRADKSGAFVSNHVSKRDLGLLESEDEECRKVHQAKDTCAFINKHCPDEEPGFLAYLSLYYCHLQSAKPVAFIILVAWLGLLFSTIGIAASDFFCIDLSTIATILGMSESMAGVTFLAFGNGSPDVFSTFAAMSTNSSSLAIGELMGAAGFITAVVAGSMALVRPFKVAKRSFIRDVGFFVVAASFSMGFLADGHLHLWECITMVAFYIFYVAFVVVWHWWLGRRLKRREKDAAARGHFIVPGNEEIAAYEEYHDEDDEDSRSGPALSRGVSAEDFSILENGNVPRIEEPDEDEEEEARERWLNELSSNMRLSRPTRGRRNTITPVRPSLVGALEFQAVLTSLQKSRNMQTIPLDSRRYSDDPTFTSAQQQDNMSSTSDPAARPAIGVRQSSDSLIALGQRPRLGLQPQGGARGRAVSASNASSLRVDPHFLQTQSGNTPKLIDIPEGDDSSLTPVASQDTSSGDAQRARSLSSAPPSDHAESLPSPIYLAPPSVGLPQGFSRHYRPTLDSQYQDSPDQSPKAKAQDSIKRRPALGQKSPLSSRNTSPFPSYRDDTSPGHSRAPSLYLPPASISAESQPLLDSEDTFFHIKPLRWWPYSILPPPQLILSTLFPTLYGWGEKNWWERTLGIIAAPSVFLLTITLPVAEADRDEDEDEHNDEPVPIGATSHGHERRKSIAALTSTSPQMLGRVTSFEHRPSGDHINTGFTGQGSAAVAANIEQEQHKNTPARTPSFPGTPAPLKIDAPPHPHAPPSPKSWNRWLTIVQLFTGPIMVVLIIYTQYIPPDDNFGLTILKPTLIALLVSFVLLVPLLLTTTPTHRPKAYQGLLAIAGFVVSIAWISTIASQVVAVLKALAVILNMSHAILGLTIFAVGNSLGDLVADITVARLGYPVMALSACFGGPMLNILLGIGLSGSWILIRGAEHRHAKHPDRPVKFRTYEIEVGDTLFVSGATLLVTLVGLLVAVPLNGWMMDKRIAWALIAVWCIGTIVNVVLEVVGTGGKTS